MASHLEVPGGRAARLSPPPVLLVGLWLVGLPALAAGAATILDALASPGVEVLLKAVAALGLLALWGAIVWKATRNYVRLRRAERFPPGGA